MSIINRISVDMKALGGDAACTINVPDNTRNAFVIVGPEGSGKTTIAQALQLALTKKAYDLGYRADGATFATLKEVIPEGEFSASASVGFDTGAALSWNCDQTGRCGGTGDFINWNSHVSRRYGAESAAGELYLELARPHIRFDSLEIPQPSRATAKWYLLKNDAIKKNLDLRAFMDVLRKNIKANNDVLKAFDTLKTVLSVTNVFDINLQHQDNLNDYKEMLENCQYAAGALLNHAINTNELLFNVDVRATESGVRFLFDGMPALSGTEGVFVDLALLDLYYRAALTPENTVYVIDDVQFRDRLPMLATYVDAVQVAQAARHCTSSVIVYPTTSTAAAEYLRTLGWCLISLPRV